MISRRHLIGRLEPVEVDSPRAVLVCAPAGYGKTTLLALHAIRLQSADRLVAWLTCDRHDSDSTHLWQAVLCALAAAVRRLPADLRPANPFDSLAVPPTMDRAFLTELTGAVDSLDAPITLVLDDFHEITDPTVLESATDFVRNLPERLTLVIGTRRDPAVPLHRLRLDGRLTEIRGADLAFGVSEVEEVLSGQGVRLGADCLASLWRRTEGWPAAVRLACLNLVDDGDPERFVADFAGDDTAVAGYLVAEILDRQSEIVQQFLLDTCVVDELTVELAAGLSGRADAGALLDRLEQVNALVQRLGRSGRWFRYHTLLRSYLLAELRRRDLGAVRARHRRAAEWFDAAGRPISAVEQAVAAEDVDMIRALLSRHGVGLLLSGHGALVGRAIADSPADVRDTPEALLIASVLAYSTHDRVGGDAALTRAEAAHPTGAGPPGGRTRRLLDVARLHRARMHGDTSALADPALVEQGRGAGGRDGDDLDLLMLVDRGALRIAAGEYPNAEADLRTALELGRRRGRHRVTLDSMNQLTGVMGALNRIDDSRSWARRTAAFAAKHGWSTSPQLAYSSLLAAWCSHLLLDLDEASHHADVATALLDGGVVEPETEVATLSGAAVIAFDRLSQRRKALSDMEVIWHRAGSAVPSPALSAFTQLANMRMCLTVGDHDRAAAVLARADRLLPGTGDVAVLRALELLDQRHHERARTWVAPILTGALETVVVTSHITAWLVEALATAHAGRNEAAHRAMLQALASGARSGVMRSFYDLGSPVRDLLLGMVGRVGHLETFLARLIRQWQAAEAWQETGGGTGHADHAGGRRRCAPTAPLTVRETEVLRDLPSLLTADEIAEQHQVSVSTVKTHMRSVYRKLGAANRRDAVTTARRLSLL